jgi:PAS domain S-box-containing protein
MQLTQEKSNKTHPLLCWDICMDASNRRQQFAGDLKHINKFIAKNDLETLSMSIEHKLIWEQYVVVITDARLNIEFASHNIETMTGFEVKDVIGNKPSMFQGAQTTQASKQTIKDAIINKASFHLDIVNYRKNGTTYICNIEAYPLFNKTGKLVNYIAFEKAA